jgi:hypothetical protein
MMRLGLRGGVGEYGRREEMQVKEEGEHCERREREYCERKEGRRGEKRRGQKRSGVAEGNEIGGEGGAGR